MKLKIAFIIAFITTVLVFSFDFVGYILDISSNLNSISEYTIKDYICFVLGTYLSTYTSSKIFLFLLIILIGFIFGYIVAYIIIKLTQHLINGIKSSISNNYPIYREHGIFRQVYKNINEVIDMIEVNNNESRKSIEAKEKCLLEVAEQLKNSVSKSLAYSEVLAQTKAIPNNMKEKEYSNIVFENCSQCEDLLNEIIFILKSNE